MKARKRFLAFIFLSNLKLEYHSKNEDKISAEKNFHSYAAASGQIMKEIQLKEAVPVHFSRKYQGALQQEFEEAYRVL